MSLPAPIPGLPTLATASLALALAAVGFRVVRRRTRSMPLALAAALVSGSLVAGVARAALVSLDGDVADWAGIPAAGLDPSGD